MNTDHSSLKYILMAGGSASRMWPLSRNAHPKPFLIPNPLGGDKSVFQNMVQHLLDGGVNPKDIFPATAANQRQFIEQQTPMIPADNIIVDPVPRDNAAAIGLAAMTVDHKHPGSTLALIWASDHYLTKPQAFVPALQLADRIVREKDMVVQINVEAESAFTHVGWINIGQNMLSEFGDNIYEFVQHKEKPDLETARRFLRQKTWLIHTGYRVCRAETLLGLYRQHAPDIYSELKTIRDAIGTDQQETVLNEVYPRIRKDSIDFAILEHVQPQGQAVIKVDLGWTDPGDFGSLYLNLPKDEVGDALSGEGEVLLRDVSNSYIHADKDILVGVVGLDNVAIVATPGALLVIDKSRAADVKKIVEDIKEQGLQKYL